MMQALRGSLQGCRGTSGVLLYFTMYILNTFNVILTGWKCPQDGWSVGDHRLKEDFEQPCMSYTRSVVGKETDSLPSAPYVTLSESHDFTLVVTCNKYPKNFVA